MAIRSILFGAGESFPVPGEVAEPEYFRDLNLDRIAAGVAEAGKEPGVAALFRLPTRDTRLVAFRQQVFRDLEEPGVREVAERFAAAMARTRRRLELIGRMKHPPQAHRWHLDLVLEHADAVTAFAGALEGIELTAPGLRALRDDMTEHVREASFLRLREQARALHDRLGEVRYDILLRGDRITVAHHDPAERFDYAEQVLAMFARFRPDPGGRPPERPGDMGLDQVEAGVLDLVVELFPDVFRDLAAFSEAHRGFIPAGLIGLERELRFYLGYLAYLAPLREAGLPFCHPAVSATDKTLLAHDAFDLALAAVLAERGERVVGNDLSLDGDERVLVVSGPNQGGKTTLSRTFGQLHHLAALGCPVPGSRARVFLPDRILTHYERAEHPEALASKLEDELLRMRDILALATPDSVIILNEIFTSTTWDDARELSATVLAGLSRLDAPCLWVSFLDELSGLDPKAVSMVGAVAEDGTTRTYKVVRRPPDGRAHALAIAERHGLTRARITERIGR
ncbi:MutS-related protein [Actinocorallia populi]|uniref:MutS-related protein n=1 Tax=Actinocorallia populi TaxID=2079200 RepID=UPI000D08BDAB|nr:DNA mismatch repair protein MutS [Actinocorallia populi]